MEKCCNFVINRPTRVTEQSATLIDHIMCNNFGPSISCYQGILITDISDHYPVFHISQYTNFKKDENKFILKRKMCPSNYAKFKDTISITDWSSVLNENDSELSFTKLYDMIKEIYNKSFPVTRIKIGYKNRLPWLSEALKVSIKTKNKLYAKCKRHNTAFNKSRYLEYKYALEKLIEKSEKRYYEELLISHKGNMKKTWSVIKNMINKNKHSKPFNNFFINGELTENPKLIADKFNEFFTNIGPSLAKKIPSDNRSPTICMRDRVLNSMVLENVISYEQY